jgi:surface protein
MYTYNYDVYWEEVGNPTNNGTETGVTNDITISVFPAGTYRVEITGLFPAIYFSNTQDERKILTIEQWGDNAWQSFNRAFNGCAYLTYNATDIPDLSNCTDFSQMFEGASSFNGDIGNWDVSTITDMYSLFKDADIFNQDIGNWNVSNVTNMRSMFDGASLFNQDITGWDVSSVISMNSMFSATYNFNQNINNWDVSNVLNMNYMFNVAQDFNQNLNNWNVSQVETMEGMFDMAGDFNGLIGNWDVSSVTNMNVMFAHAQVFNQDIGNWNVSNVTDMSGMFGGAQAFDQNVGSWDVSNVTTMTGMFGSAQAFDQNIGSWDVSNVTSMTYMFQGAGVSNCNYDALLLGWSQLNLENNISFESDNSTYSSGIAADARQSIIDDFGWSFSDAGLDSLGCATTFVSENNKLEFSVFPNPTSDYLNVTYSTKEKINLALFSSTGQIIYEKEINPIEGKGSTQVELTNYKGGVYFLQLTSNGSIKTEKVILNK